MTLRPMTGADLARARKAAGLNQTQLGKRIGRGRHAVSYWEVKSRLPGALHGALRNLTDTLRDLGTLAWTIRRGTNGRWAAVVEDAPGPPRARDDRGLIFAADPAEPNHYAHAQGDGVLNRSAACRISPQYARARESEPVSAAALLAAGHLSPADRKMLRAMARWEAAQARKRAPCGARTRKGHPCRNLSEPSRRRCKFHGGKSTGPRTAEGRARIAAAMRERHRRKRAGQ